MCGWTKLAAINFGLALALAGIFRALGMADASAIFVIAAALSVAQALYWAWVCR